MLKGTLDDFTLPDIFRLLSHSKKTGRLDVQRSAGQGNVFFRDGNVYFAESTLSKELIGQKLVKAKVLTDGQLMKALDDQAEGSGGRLGEILLAGGLVSNEQLEAAVRSQIEDAVFDLLRWDAGEFDWAPNEEVDAEVSVSATVENLIMEGSRRLDELAIITRKIPSENAVVAMAPTPPEGAAQINITPDEWRMLVLVNGQRTVLDIAESTGSDVFATMRTLYGLAAAGLVHVPGHVVEEDDEPLPELPLEQADVLEAVVEETPAAEASELESSTDAEEEPTALVAEFALDDDDDSTVESSDYHADAYNPDVAAADEFSEEAFVSEVFSAEPEIEAPVVAEETEVSELGATDLPTGDWFDAPEPGDLMAETPAEEGADADPFVSEVLAPESSVSELQEDTTDTHDDEAEEPLAEPVAESEDRVVDKRAAVQELSDLFKQSEVENTPTFLVPQVQVEGHEDHDIEMHEPEEKRRVEDDEDITRGLISRLIDGVKGL